MRGKKMIDGKSKAEKECSCCHIIKPRIEFTKRSSSPDGMHYYCKSCSRIRNNKYNDIDRNKDRERYRNRGRRYRIKYYSNPAYRVRGMLYRAKTRAKYSGIPFEIEESEIIVPEFCPVLGMKLKTGISKRGDNSPSLDRINNELGYIPGNVMVISDRANRLKNNGTAEEHEKIAQYLRLMETGKCLK